MCNLLRTMCRKLPVVVAGGVRPKKNQKWLMTTFLDPNMGKTPKNGDD